MPLHTHTHTYPSNILPHLYATVPLYCYIPIYSCWIVGIVDWTVGSGPFFPPCLGCLHACHLHALPFGHHLPATALPFYMHEKSTSSLSLSSHLSPYLVSGQLPAVSQSISVSLSLLCIIYLFCLWLGLPSHPPHLFAHLHTFFSPCLCMLFHLPSLLYG